MTNYFRALLYLYGLNSHSSWSPEKLANFQAKRLRNIIRYAYEFCPFYHEIFDKSRVKPYDIRTPKDLVKLPILTKKDIRDNTKSMISAKYSLEKLHELSTSGSTGTPLFFYVSQSELEFRKAKHLRANMSCGQKPFDRWITVTSPHHFAESTRMQQIIGLYSPRPISVFEDVAKQVLLAEKMKPDVLDGYSSSLFLLSKELQRTGNKKIKPRFVIGGAELIDDSSREFIESTLQAPFYDQYSSVEMERMSSQCKCKRGYHIDSDALVIEFLDKNGEEVSMDEPGEIVCTSLFNFAMPFIRYAIGDLGRPSDELCSCGRPFPLMSIIEGRKDSLLILPDGRLITPRAFTIALRSFESYNLIDQFRIVQDKKDRFRIIIKTKTCQFHQETFEKAVNDYLLATLKLDPDSVKMDIEIADDIPLDKNGKLMAVVSNVRP